MTPLLAIDTSVLVEYIDEDGDFHFQAKEVLKSIISGKLAGVIAHPIFVELYYISYRLYEKLGGESPESRAGGLINWLFKSPNILVPENILDFAIAAGAIKRKFSLSLPDSYVIASAKLHGCPAIFKNREKEMKGNKLEKLEKEDKVRLVFLGDYR